MWLIKKHPLRSFQRFPLDVSNINLNHGEENEQIAVEKLKDDTSVIVYAC